MNTLLTFDQQESLVSQGLAIRKVDDAQGLVTYKYHRKVMFDNLWNKYPETLECRGHVYSLATGELVQAPPRKSFNYLENGHWQGLPLDTPVRYMKKYNGFMAAATMHQGRRIISTTGTTTSQYVSMAAQYIDVAHPQYCE
jgi:hypothetical protein